MFTLLITLRRAKFCQCLPSLGSKYLGVLRPVKQYRATNIFSSHNNLKKSVHLLKLVSVQVLKTYFKGEQNTNTTKNISNLGVDKELVSSKRYHKDKRQKLLFFKNIILFTPSQPALKTVISERIS